VERPMDETDGAVGFPVPDKELEEFTDFIFSTLADRREGSGKEKLGSGSLRPSSLA